jgi:hypothetical protein
LERYFNVSDENEKAISQLVSLVTDPAGSVLFNKILAILVDNPPDDEQFDHFAAALKYIIQSDFGRLFEQHKWAVSQIEKMTPQALSILADNANWPTVTLGTVETVGTKVVSDYNDEFAVAFARQKGISDVPRIKRLKHSIGELTGGHFIEAHKSGVKRLEPDRTCFPILQIRLGDPNSRSRLIGADANNRSPPIAEIQTEIPEIWDSLARYGNHQAPPSMPSRLEAQEPAGK